MNIYRNHMETGEDSCTERRFNDSKTTKPAWGDHFHS